MSVESTSPSRPTAKQWVFGFEEGSAEMRDLLGGKGANLAEMTHVLGSARVPGGFTITTEACVHYMKTDGRFPEGLEEEITEAVTHLEGDAGQQFGGGRDPLLLSVRSGAPVSMPGMLDTVLNLGLNAESVQTLSEASDNPRFAWDSYRRLVQMYSDVVRGVPSESFEDELAKAREATGSTVDADLDQDTLRQLTERFLALFTEHTGEQFPADPREQLRGAVEAVFRSWNNDRAIAYRRFEGIPDELGTAVTVQRMVFGNRGSDSGSGVAFTRDPTTGASEPEGDFLLNAQGEDVVAGVRNTENLADLARRMPEAHAELIDALKRLERHYRDMQDVEYTIEQGRLYILQTRDAKRPAQAAVRFASDAVGEGLLGREEALATIDPGSLDALLHPTFDPGADLRRADASRPRLSRRSEGRDRVHGRGSRTARGGRQQTQPNEACQKKKKKKKSNCFWLLDELALGHLAGAVNVELRELEARPRRVATPRKNLSPIAAALTASSLTRRLRRFALVASRLGDWKTAFRSGVPPGYWLSPAVRDRA